MQEGFIAVIEVLLVDRPDDVQEAVMALQSRPKMWKRVHKEIDVLTVPRRGV